MRDRPHDNVPSILDVLVVGVSPELETLRSALQHHSAVSTVVQVPHTHHAWGEVQRSRFNTVIIDLQAPYDDIDSIAYTILQMREALPEIVFALLADEEEFATKIATVAQVVKTRLSHYYRLPRTVESGGIEKLVERCVQWRRTLTDQRPYNTRYVYDVALSFAGEQRHHAEELATILREQNVRVFYDSFEQAELWGKDLFEFLFDIYSKQSRYCVVFVSAEYASKMWTVHERRAAQERVLKERDVEYLLPIRVDDTPLPGLPDTVAYVTLSEGINKIARLVIRKLQVAIASGN